MKERKLMIIGGGHLCVQEILDKLSQVKIPIKKIQLLGEGERVGEIHEFGDQPLLVTDTKMMIEEDYDAAVFLSPVKDLESLTETLIVSKVPVLDMANLFKASTEAPVLLPDSITYKSLVLPRVAILPTGPAHALMTTLYALKNTACWKSATLFSLQGVSSLGTRQGMDELFDQTRNIMAFTDVECLSFPRQIAFNAFHCSNRIETLTVIESQARIICERPQITVAYDSAWCGFFVGLIGTIWLQASEKIHTEKVKEDLEKAKGIELKEAVEGILSVVGNENLVIGDISYFGESSDRLTLRFAMDNLQRGLATTLAVLLKQIWVEK